MKKTISFRISNKVKEILETKANLFKMTKTEFLECIIKEFGDSTEEEKKNQREKRKEARIEFFKNRPDASSLDAWASGFINGWEQFQTRKFSSLFHKLHEKYGYEYFKTRKIRF